MTKFKVKICGIKDNSIIDCCIENGIDYFGLVFYSKSPRFINEELAIELINYAKNKKITPVGVFVNHNIDALKSFIEKSKITLIQLHGSEDNDYVKSLKKNFNIKVIKSVGIRTSYDFEKLESFSECDYFLFDYKPEQLELPGGNAKRFDWSLLEKITVNKSWFLSGGLNINNIIEIKSNLFPYGIDISSGVEEREGIKSSKKIKDIMKKLNEF